MYLKSENVVADIIYQLVAELNFNRAKLTALNQYLLRSTKHICQYFRNAYFVLDVSDVNELSLSYLLHSSSVKVVFENNIAKLLYINFVVIEDPLLIVEFNEANKITNIKTTREYQCCKYKKFGSFLSMLYQQFKVAGTFPYYIIDEVTSEHKFSKLIT